MGQQEKAINQAEEYHYHPDASGILQLEELNMEAQLDHTCKVSVHGI
jgi:hypothetical protein